MSERTPVHLTLHDAATLLERCGRGTAAATWDFVSVDALIEAIRKALATDDGSICGCHRQVFERVVRTERQFTAGKFDHSAFGHTPRCNTGGCQ